MCTYIRNQKTNQIPESVHSIVYNSICCPVYRIYINGCFSPVAVQRARTMHPILKNPESLDRNVWFILLWWGVTHAHKTNADMLSPRYIIYRHVTERHRLLHRWQDDDAPYTRSWLWLSIFVEIFYALKPNHREHGGSDLWHLLRSTCSLSFTLSLWILT